MGAGRIVNSVLGLAGLQLTRVRKRPGGKSKPATDPFKESLAKVSRTPLDAKAHLAHARVCLENGRPELAHAEVRTAEYLGGGGIELEDLRQRALSASIPLEEMSHNRYYRLFTLANAVREFGGEAPCSVLDVGGGIGDLSRFLPKHSYCLAEPVSNGISGEKLPFPKESFDLVVACHVLEHIPKQHRTDFLVSMLNHSRMGIILLNPFYVEGYNEVEGLELTYEHTKADWALEHLECVVPEVEEVTDLAKAKGLEHVVRPNGNKLSGMAVFLADFFSAVHKDDRLRHFNRYMNTRLNKHLDNPAAPMAYLIYLKKSAGPI